MSSAAHEWRETDFDDTQWASSPSGFAFYTYSYEATTLTGFDAARCHAFRHEFSITSAGEITWLILRIDYSGGFVAWLNGVEIARRGLPGAAGSAVPWDAPATLHNRGVPEEIDVSDAIGVLRTGQNVLAIQWHHSAGSTSYGTALVAELLANFTRGPLIQNSSARSVCVIWKTLMPSDSVVEYGLTPDLGQTAGDAGLSPWHQVGLTDLAPDTVYYYRVASRVNAKNAVSPVFTFRTLRESGPFSFTAMADMGLSSVPQYKIARVVRESRPDLVLAVGDLIYPAYTAGREDFRFFSVYGEHMRNTPYFVVAGNHDTLIGSEQDFFAAFCMPTNDVSPQVHAASRTGPEHYYSFDHGDAHFAGLYVFLMNAAYGLTNDSPQLVWLEKDLAASNKPWKFIFVHHPVVSSNGHKNDDYNYNGIPDCTELGNLLLPIARRRGVQMIIAGHDHVYERFNPIGGVCSVVTGGGGGPLYGLTQLDPATAQFWARYECVKISGNTDELTLQAFGDDGMLFDTMYIRRTPLPRMTFEAAWGRPRIEDISANDGDGNVFNQTFDLKGTPIPSLPGNFSNIGRLWVNRDHWNLYLGFEQVMIYGDNTLFVFIESPDQPGVTTLAGLGNGAVDPQGEGADGLDFLENLSFRDFRPSIACVLGDELADGQFRAFQRPNSVLDTGQGVFRLDAGFSTVEGVHVQQYNRSPQSAPFPGEQNANFIEVAIPLAALSLTNGKHTIRIGAVVGGAECDVSPQRQSRFLDRSHLGLSMTGSGTGPVELEGVTVDIGPDLDDDGDGLTAEEENRIGTDPASPDSDKDGLPDGFEVTFWLNPLTDAGSHGASGDPDGDGLTNLEEFIAGTNPRDRSSVLRLNIERPGDRLLMLMWQAVPGRAYRLEAASEPGAQFQPLPGFENPRRATTTTEVHFLPDAWDDGITARFYRLLVWP